MSDAYFNTSDNWMLNVELNAVFSNRKLHSVNWTIRITVLQNVAIQNAAIQKPAMQNAALQLIGRWITAC